MSISDINREIGAIGYAKVIVVLKPNAAAAELAAGASYAKGPIGTADLAGHFIVPSLGQSESLAASAMRSSSKALRRKSPAPAATQAMRVYPYLGLALGFVNGAGARALRADPRIDHLTAAPNPSLIRPMKSAFAKAPKTGVSWGIRRLNIDKLWDAGIKGRGIVVGHLDTGVDGTHPDLQGAIHTFIEFDKAGMQVPNARPTDSDWHGTHTAGTIVGRPGKYGSYGVAPEAKLASGMVIEGGAVIDRIIAGLEWLVAQQCPIVSLSLGLRDYTDAFEILIAAMRKRNVLPVIAIGNEFANTSRSPGNYPNVLSVGAMDEKDRVADFSGSQQFLRPLEPVVPSLVAPGVRTFSCLPNGGFGESEGSSMATPRIAGLAALLLQARPDAKAADLENAIKNSCRLPKNMSTDRANRGVPDAVLAYELLTERKLEGKVAGAENSRSPAAKRAASKRAAAKKAAAKKAGPKKAGAKMAGAKKAGAKKTGAKKAAAKRAGGK